MDFHSQTKDYSNMRFSPFRNYEAPRSSGFSCLRPFRCKKKLVLHYFNWSPGYDIKKNTLLSQFNNICCQKFVFCMHKIVFC